jgi:sortase A
MHLGNRNGAFSLDTRIEKDMTNNSMKRRIITSISLSLIAMTIYPTSSHATGFDLHAGDYLGTISIPAIKSVNPIYEGTGVSELKKGVGHFVGSVLPGVIDNSVLAGHRDSVFAKLTKLKIGDLIVISDLTGKFTYKVSKFRIVMANDRTVIVPTKTAVLTLTTCYPFDFSGSAPQRFIVSADLITRGVASRGI